MAWEGFLVASAIVSFLAGIVALAMPCCFSVLLPSYFASCFRRRTAVFGMTLVFALGIAAILIPIALGVSAVSTYISLNHSLLFVIGGFFMLFLGAASLLGIQLMPMVHPDVNLQKGNVTTVFALGLFSGVASSCCAPVLAGILVLTALTGSGLSPTDAYNAIQNWINGVCLTTTQYSALGSYINSAGTPPGYSSSLPPLTVCGNSGSTSGTGSTSSAGSGSGNTTTSSGPPGAPPGLPSSLASAMLSNGEHIVGQAWDPVYQDWVYLTNKGGIYNLNATGGQGNGFMGSIFNLPNNHANWFNAAGQQIRQAERITVNPDGSYTITDTNGETYNFTPGVAASLGIPVPTKPAPTAPAA